MYDKEDNLINVTMCCSSRCECVELWSYVDNVRQELNMASKYNEQRMRVL